MRPGIEHVFAKHVLARCAAGSLGDFGRKVFALFGASGGRVKAEGLDWNLEPKAARRRGAGGTHFPMYAAHDRVVVAEARERPVAVDEQSDLGRLRVHNITRCVGKYRAHTYRLGEYGSANDRHIAGWLGGLAAGDNQQREYQRSRTCWLNDPKRSMRE